jgi:hypothetical protein
MPMYSNYGEECDALPPLLLPLLLMMMTTTTSSLRFIPSRRDHPLGAPDVAGGSAWEYRGGYNLGADYGGDFDGGAGLF